MNSFHVKNNNKLFDTPVIFLIVDFNAGNSITHHLNYVLTYAKFINDEGFDVKLVLPKYTPLREIKSVNFDIRQVLASRNYRFDRSYLIFLKIYKILLKLLGKHRIRFESIIDSSRDNLYIKKAYNSIQKIVKEEDREFCLFFPTVDFMAIDYIEKFLSKDKSSDYIYLRFNAISEEVRSYNSKSVLEILDSLLLLYPERIVIGCETKKVMEILRNRSKDYKYLFFAPPPAIKRGSVENKDKIFGFLGGAKKRKGFLEIPQIIMRIDAVTNDAKYLVQQSPFDWEGYKTTLDRLKKIKTVKLLFDVLSNKDFFHSISQCSFIVAPYDGNSYGSGGSSIFYYAADFYVPTITYEDLPFSEEIIEFECGIIINKNLDFDEKMFSKLSRQKLTNGLVKYNEYRNVNNRLFLNLTIR